MIDLSQLSSIDSTGIHLLVDLHRRLSRPESPRLEILPRGRAVRRVFQLTRLDKYLPIAEGP